MIADLDIPKPGSDVDGATILSLLHEAKRYNLYHKVLKALHGKNMHDKILHFDGCTHWLQYYEEHPIYKACFFHDVAYWIGGSEIDRLIADSVLMVDIAIITKDIQFAEVMFQGVRWFGKSSWKLY